MIKPGQQSVRERGDRVSLEEGKLRHSGQYTVRTRSEQEQSERCEGQGPVLFRRKRNVLFLLYGGFIKMEPNRSSRRDTGIDVEPKCILHTQTFRSKTLGKNTKKTH